MSSMMLVVGLIFGLIIALAAQGDKAQKTGKSEAKKPEEKK